MTAYVPYRPAMRVSYAYARCMGFGRLYSLRYALAPRVRRALALARYWAATRGAL